MRLNPELIRALLLQLEAAPANQRTTKFDIEGYDQDTVFEHLELLIDAGLIEGSMLSGGMGQHRSMAASIHRLTMAGHDFLNSARNDTVWRKAMAVIKEKGGAVSFEVLKALVIQGTKAHFGLP